MKGRHTLITGSTSGIGWGLAKSFAKVGSDITLNGFALSDVVNQMKRELETEFGVRVQYSSADMSRPSEIRAMVAEAEATFGGVDILINNAGIQNVAAVEDFADEKWDGILAVNLSSVFHTIKAVVPRMKTRGFGRIINVASVHGLVASPYKSAYVAAKHGVLGLTKTVALELAETAITCNAICPGYVRTPLVDGQIAQQAAAHKMPESQVIRDVILASQPNKAFVEIEHLADMALLLASPSGRAITGASMVLDGGWTAR